MIITMLGTSGSGKTTYMAAMGHKYYLNDVNGYKLQSANNEYKNITYINRVLTIPANLLYNKRVFPDGTGAEISVLELNLWGKKWNNYGVPEPIININFIDYPGIYIDQLAVGNKSSENEQVLSNILLSDVVIVFVDATVLKSCDEYSLQYRIGATSILPLLTKAATRQSLNIVFMITKCDASIIDINNDIELLKSKVRKAYSSFLYYNNVSCCFIPVGAIGFGAVSTANTSLGAISNAIRADVPIKPYNIASSFAKAILFCLERNKQLLEYKRNETDRMRKEANNTLHSDSEIISLIKNSIDILFNDSKTREKIIKATKEVERLSNEVIRLESYKSGLEAIARMED